MLATAVLYFIVTGFAYVVHPALQRYFQARFPSIPESQRVAMPPQKSSGNESNLASEKPSVIIGLPTSSLQPPKARSRLSSITAKIRNNSLLKDPSMDVPLKAQLPMYVVAFIYCCSRTTIWIWNIIQFRDLPASTFTTVSWGSFFAHLS